MANIAEIDKNFKIESGIQKDDVKFHNPMEKPFKIYGLMHDGTMFRRMPEEIAKTINLGVFELHGCCSGGRIRFKTDSPYIAIVAEMGMMGKMPHFPFTGSIGFDVYVRENGKERYVNTFKPAVDITERLCGVVEMDTNGMQEITINFPPYSEVKEVFVGLKEGSAIEEHPLYKTETPVVYYGSSITQGGCTSRPGNAYYSIISREFDCNYLNLGFSGNALGEDSMADYIKELDMKLFVYDYDHNAPDVEHLKNTHERMFKRIREKHPDLPVIMLTRPNFVRSDDDVERMKVVKATYENALAAGDKNVYFIDGKDLVAEAGNEGTVDNCHPNDLGFYMMAKSISKLIKENNLL